MDWLARLSGSPLPNVLALTCLALFAAVAFVTRRRQAGVRVLTLLVLFTATVLAKNLAYSITISGPHRENSMAAHLAYSHVLFCIALCQLTVAIVLIVNSFMIRDLAWLGFFAVSACCLAAACMFDWSMAYLRQSANLPIHYELNAPWTQILVLATLAVTAVMSIVTPMRRSNSRRS